jgi:hypothetical protein
MPLRLAILRACARFDSDQQDSFLLRNSKAEGRLKIGPRQALQKPTRQPMQNEQLAKTRSASQNAQSPHQVSDTCDGSPRVAPAKACPSVPSMGRIYRDERSSTE